MSFPSFTLLHFLSRTLSLSLSLQITQAGTGYFSNMLRNSSSLKIANHHEVSGIKTRSKQCSVEDRFYLVPDSKRSCGLEDSWTMKMNTI